MAAVPLPLSTDSLCPDLRQGWQLGTQKHSSQAVLQHLATQRLLFLSPEDVRVLPYCTGRWTVAEVQQRLGDEVSPGGVAALVERIVRLGDAQANESPVNSSSLLKPGVQWFPHPDGYWILRNGEDFTFLQIDELGKAVTDDLALLSPGAVAQKHGLTLGQVQQHLGLLAAAGMLPGTRPQAPPPKRFTPWALLFFLWPLFNPDAWLTRHLPKVRWLFYRGSAWGLLLFLAFWAAVGFSQQRALVVFGGELWQNSGFRLLLPFIVLSLLVVSLHELAHAFTLKYFGGRVPQMGLMFMALFPAAYTDTTDAYCLTQRRQRFLVVAAGVLCQLFLAALALCFWNLTLRGSWLHTGSYLLLVASLLTVTLNLNPVAKFDGYYLAVALSGINNLRSRAFLFYRRLLTGHPLQEKRADALFLAFYAPVSLLYLWWVFGFLFYRLVTWILTNIPFLTLSLLAIWAVYYFYPRGPFLD
ncbi:MAG: hypothetical protein SAJ72_24540 [Jaaginema sp. PMC 1080.18]|nr:hypothetical protein [Jaaginema sp. PMC 1080.18]MEC4868938.1 hypothetical protein [Jaaginema sp. PMC 1078.18]